MKKSAGLLLYRQKKTPEFFLVHPGGPFWQHKDAGVWSIPKGEFTDEELPLAAAIREMEEETGVRVSGHFIELSPILLKSGKQVFAWAIEKDIDAANIKSNEIDIEWPPRSGKTIRIPEVDRGGWFGTAAAREKISAGQLPLINELANLLKQ